MHNNNNNNSNSAAVFALTTNAKQFDIVARRNINVVIMRSSDSLKQSEANKIISNKLNTSCCCYQDFWRAGWWMVGQWWRRARWLGGAACVAVGDEY
jgi:hypothetical protein